ncbi:methylmalonyl Co-A mutase-associated GTPase MeaB [Haloarchaeobius iranensis]|uniref:LAO/AO transport system kinase n=1 Tax=Haloarchaeobius iranensis TaxID=996166 RepID=A0A1G9WMC5_9EURY|nr:methylmalonyl Co-A mutase-associated GTPase MeaB [Haloarchaeobius iranensis]SDM85195.1 LAO/AO transport system kinase [Haloarchaeobius iranensis]
MSESAALLDDLLAGKHRALARVITKIENRDPGYRELVSGLYEHTGNAEVIGITGSPGAGKSTLVDKLAEHYREQGETVGVVAIDPSSPYTGGAVLGDRIRMASNVGDMDVFFRSMSARGNLGGLSTATADAVKAMDAFGKDKVIIETVGAGQNEIDIVGAADTVTVLVPPGAGDNVQMLKAGILEIADIFVVNKADMDGADRTVQELTEMVHLGQGSTTVDAGHHGFDEVEMDLEMPADTDPWKPPIVETVATDGEGVVDLVETFAEHRAFLESSGELTRRRRQRVAEEIRTLLRDDAAGLVADELEDSGGVGAFVDGVMSGDTDPYTIADDVMAPIRDCVEDQ